MQYADGALTTLSSAIVYSDAHAKALKAGLSEKDAEARAMGAMDAAIWRFSQPVMFSAKSPVENNSHAAMKLLYMFASDARLKTGIIIDAVQSIKDGKGSKADHMRRIGVVFLGAILAQTVSNVYRDIFSDDDDDEIYTAAGYARAVALAPFQGFFLLGTAIDVGVSSVMGQRAYTNSSNPLVTSGINAINAAKHSSDILQTDDMEAFFKELGRIARAISLTPVTAVPAAVPAAAQAAALAASQAAALAAAQAASPAASQAAFQAACEAAVPAAFLAAFQAASPAAFLAAFQAAYEAAFQAATSRALYRRATSFQWSLVRSSINHQKLRTVS
jgi:hypothetical protein